MRLREPLHDRYTNDQQKFVTDINRSPKSVRTATGLYVYLYALTLIALTFIVYARNRTRNRLQRRHPRAESRVPSTHALQARAPNTGTGGEHTAHARRQLGHVDAHGRHCVSVCAQGTHAHSGQHRQRDRQHGRHTFPAGSQSYVLESAARTNRVATLDSLAIDAHSLAVHVIPDHHTWARRL